MEWECNSKIINGLPCGYSCKANSEFEPRECLYTPLFESWNIVNKTSVIENKCPEMPDNLSLWKQLVWAWKIGFESEPKYQMLKAIIKMFFLVIIVFLVLFIYKIIFM